MSIRRGPKPAVRRAVWDRDDGACVCCGHTITGPYSLQHRRARGMGGTNRPDTNRPPNLLLMCGTATTGCHQWTESHPADAVALGYRLNQAADPAKVPAYVRGVGLVFLTDEGGYVPAPSKAAS